MLMRRQLGEDVPIGDLHWRTAMVFKQTVYGAVVDNRRYAPDEVDELLVEVERVAEARDHRPTVVS